jgi:uncharacterized membrane protein YjjP (DUF1212 family)
MTHGPDAEARRRAVRVALRLGVVMLASGAQAHEVEASLRAVMAALGLAGGEAVVTYSTVTVSFIAEVDADATTATQVVRRWQPDYNRLAAASVLARDIIEGRADLHRAEDELELVVASRYPYPRWLGFAAPALLSMAVTILFGGTVEDALATLAIGIGIQPALERIEASVLSSFFQVVFGVSATALLVVLLVKLGLPINGGLVLTGSLLRFLPGAQLVSGMHDFIGGALLSGTIRLAEVVLLGAAVAGAASLVLTFGARLDVPMRITSDGRVDWPGAILVVAGSVAVAFYACRLGVPRKALVATSALGGVAVVITQALTPGADELTRNARTLLAALLIGIVGRYLAHRSRAPGELWMVPAILPLLPAPATLLPLLAETETARESLQGQAVETAFSIGVGVAMGSIVVETYLRYRARLIKPVVGAVSGRLSGRPATRGTRKRRLGRSAISRKPRDPDGPIG